MLCDEDQGRATREFLENFNIKAFQKRIPLVGAIELTYRCNLNCVHCYVSNGKRKSSKEDAELPARQWMNWIDQFAEAGCLFLLFTGGETILRPDFPELYAYACRKGMLVTVFTNGTLLTERVFQAFADYPPHCVEITLYGSTADTYEKITGVPGSFEKCMKAIFRLKKGGVHLKLKTMLLTLNSHELEDMKAFASDLGVSFRYDAGIFPRLNSDKTPLQYRVTPELAVQKDSFDRKHVKHWHDLYQRLKNLPATDTLYACGAGVSIFHADPKGILRPCFMVPGEKFDLKHHRFYDIWHEKEFIDFRNPGEMPPSCQKCDKISLCGYCPGFFYLETGDERIPSTFLCKIGAYRRNMIFNYISEEQNNAKQ